MDFFCEICGIFKNIYFCERLLLHLLAYRRELFLMFLKPSWLWTVSVYFWLLLISEIDDESEDALETVRAAADERRLSAIDAIVGQVEILYSKLKDDEDPSYRNHSKFLDIQKETPKVFSKKNCS